MEKGPFCSKIKETDQPNHSEISRTYPSLPQGIPTPSIRGVHIINGRATCPTATIIYLLPQLIYGYGSLEDTLFRSTISKEGEIFFVEDKEIGLRDLAMNAAIPTDPGKRTVKGNFC